jgi:hypothetical protein
MNREICVEKQYGFESIKGAERLEVENQLPKLTQSFD